MWDAVKPLFGGRFTREQLAGLDLIRDASTGLPLKHRAYILATAYHESGATMQPVREAFGDSDDESIARLERAWERGQLKWVSRPYWRKDADGKSWLGRGLVQLTFKENYQRAGDKLGVDLVENPDLAMHPEVSVRILVRGMAEGWFTGKRMADYPDYVSMRRVVNGTDRAALIAGYADKFEVAIRDIKEPAKVPDPHIPTDILPSNEPPGPLAVLVQMIAALIKSIFGAKK